MCYVSSTMDFTNSSVIIQRLENCSNDPLNNLDNIVNHLKRIISATQSNLAYR